MTALNLTTTTTITTTIPVDLSTSGPIAGLVPAYGYVPNFIAGIVLAAILLLSSLAHSVQVVRLNRPTSYLLGAASLTEAAGWAARVWAARQPYHSAAFLVQLTTLLVGPALAAAALYAAAGMLVRQRTRLVEAGCDARGGVGAAVKVRIKRQMKRRVSVLPAGAAYPAIFGLCELVALVAQAWGLAFASRGLLARGAAALQGEGQGEEKGDAAASAASGLGTNILACGVVFQMGVMTAFLVLFVLFLVRSRRFVGRKLEHWLVAAMLLAFAALYARNIYRAVSLLSLAEDSTRGLMATSPSDVWCREDLFIATEGGLVALAMVVFNFFDPAVVLRKDYDPDATDLGLSPM